MVLAVPIMKQLEASPCLATTDVGEIEIGVGFAAVVLKVRVLDQSSLEEKHTSVE